MGSACCKDSEEKPRNGEKRLDETKEPNRATGPNTVEKEIAKAARSDLPDSPAESRESEKGSDLIDTMEEDAMKKLSITPWLLSEALTKLAVDLYLKIEKGKNVVISPLSIALALALLEHGASGKTREEILKLISPVPDAKNDKSQGENQKPINSVRPFDGQDCGKLYAALLEKILNIPMVAGQLCIGNSVFCDVDYFIAVKEKYLQSVKKYFKNETIKAPFQNATEEARQQVNGWISEKTMGKIEEFYPTGGLSADTAVLLINAIYMKMDWKYQFDGKETKERTFYQTDGKEQHKVKFMCGRRYPYTRGEDFQAIELPYKAGMISMYIILPRDRNGIKQLEQKLKPDFLLDVFKQMGGHHVAEVDEIEIPKFTMRFKTSLISALGQLGFSTLDQLDRMFDKHRMDPSRKKPEISDIKHEACIKTDEKGTEAQLEEIPDYNDLSHYIPSVRFVADHPFLFILAHKPTWSIVLMGKVESVDNE